MNNWQINLPEWILFRFFTFTASCFTRWGIVFAALLFLFTAASVNRVQAQTDEDTTRTPRELPEEQENEYLPDPAETPYQMDVPESDINRYQLQDYGSSNRFYRQLEHSTPEDFLMREEEGYQRYGEEWERKINEDLMAILRATFKEDSEIMKLWKSIAPFLSFGIWEPYEVPITRVDYPNKVPAEEK